MKSVSLTLDQLLRARQSNSRTPVLGGRELDIMKILWREGARSAQEVLHASGESNLSLSTIQSTLERLHRKELVSRQKTGRFYLYRAALSRSTVISQLMVDIAEQFGEGDLAPMISGFASFIGQEAPNQTSEALPESLLRAMQSLSNKDDD